MNARSACSKIPEIQHYIIDKNPDLCAITETWIKKDDKAILMAIPPKDYLIKSTVRYDQARGRVTMVYRSDLAFGDH